MKDTDKKTPTDMGVVWIIITLIVVVIVVGVLMAIGAISPEKVVS